MALLILALLQRIFLMSSLMLLLVWLIFFMVLIKLLPILGTISGKTVKLMVLALICLGNNRQDCHPPNCMFSCLQILEAFLWFVLITLLNVTLIILTLSVSALKPAIEACGISTLSQSPMLGFHKQMDNRIKLLEEILSFRMQGVEFDNGDMYVDGHKAASDVRDEFVSVTEKLMDELAQCYNVLPQLDINNTIDHRPEGDEKWFLENEKTVTQFCRKLAAERPLKDIRDEYNYPKKKGIKDECSRLLEASTMKSRRGF